MGVQFEIYENLAESEIFEKLVETPRLCQLLNPALELKKQRGIAREHFIVTGEYEEKPLRTISRPGEQQSRPGGLSYGGIARIETGTAHRLEKSSPGGLSYRENGIARGATKPF